MPIPYCRLFLSLFWLWAPLFHSCSSVFVARNCEFLYIYRENAKADKKILLAIKPFPNIYLPAMDCQSHHQLPVCFYPSLCGYELHRPIFLLLPCISSVALLSLSLATNQSNHPQCSRSCSTWLINTHIQRLHYTPALSQAKTGIFCTPTKIKQLASLWTL